MRSVGDRGVAGSTRAGVVLGAFSEDHPNWIRAGGRGEVLGCNFLAKCGGIERDVILTSGLIVHRQDGLIQLALGHLALEVELVVVRIALRERVGQSGEGSERNDEGVEELHRELLYRVDCSGAAGD
jgi:hypothetical protein